MRYAGPNRKPNEAAVRKWIAGGKHEEDSERRVDRQDHLQVLGLADMPRPTRRPKNRQRVHPEQEDEPNKEQRDSQEFDAITVRHGLPPVDIADRHAF